MAQKKTNQVKKTAKKAVKKAVRDAKKGNYGGIIGILLLVIVIIAVAVGGYYLGLFDFIFEDDDHHDTTNPVVVDTDDLSIHFLELGNWYTGDCTYIKIGDTDVLIDAGSRRGSAETIANYVDQYCTDGILEYVIVTHAHEDHIAGFVGTNSIPGIFARYDCKTIIDFSRTEATSDLYYDYLDALEAEVKAGAKHYTVLDCYNNANGAQRKYTLADGVELEFLYQKYYEADASTENNYSVCCMINQGNNHYLFTGDLESVGEKSLVQLNNLPHCVLYKAGHHGSKTSSSNALLEEITPEVVCVCCCAGSSEYTKTEENQFPTQEFCARVSAFTDKVYVTTLSTDNDKKAFTSMNGNIVFTSKGTTYSVNCSNNNTILKDTTWCKNNRIWSDQLD